MSLLSFDAGTHVYFVDGVPVPSVSQVIEAETNEYYDNSFAQSRLEVAKNRGTLVHKTIENIINSELSFSRDYEESRIIYETIRVYDDWVMKNKIVVLKNEMMLTNGIFAGTVDLLVEEDGKLVLVDVKATSKITPMIELQLAGYYMLLRDNGIEVSACKVLHIKPSKTKFTYTYKDVSINLFKFKELLKQYE